MVTSWVTRRMEAPGGVEPPTNSLGNCCSIQLSYGAAGLIVLGVVRESKAWTMNLGNVPELPGGWPTFLIFHCMHQSHRGVPHLCAFFAQSWEAIAGQRVPRKYKPTRPSACEPWCAGRWSRASHLPVIPHVLTCVEQFARGCGQVGRCGSMSGSGGR